jgi:hypothetical protein
MTRTLREPSRFRRLQALAVPAPGATALERCDFCREAIAAEHGHVVNRAQRALLCVCRACYLLFTQEGAAGGRFRSVPARYEEISDFDGSSSIWHQLGLPVGLAFVFFNSVRRQPVAFYPSAGGAIESELRLTQWSSVVESAPPLQTLSDDVEALLVRQPANGALRAYIVPIDACYELVARIRRLWRGFHGGEEVWREVDTFFATIAARARHSGTP